jgi:hypothetical protein
MTCQRIAPGAYAITNGSHTVTISRIDGFDARYGQWVAAADWDRNLVTDPMFTLADAKAQAAIMLAEVTST